MQHEEKNIIMKENHTHDRFLAIENEELRWSSFPGGCFEWIGRLEARIFTFATLDLGRVVYVVLLTSLKC